MVDRKPHRFAEIFPMLDGEELQALANDIRDNEQQKPIIIFKDQILDGRNRYAACKLVGKTPIMKLFSGSEEAALKFVMSSNLHRRHLTSSQRAMVAAKMADMPIGKPVTLGIEKSDDNTDAPEQNPTVKKTTIKEAASRMAVSPASVKKAKKIIKEAPEQAKKVDTGELTVDAAHKEVLKSSGKSSDKEMATKMGNTVIATLGRIKKEYRKDIFDRVRIWIMANIDL